MFLDPLPGSLEIFTSSANGMASHRSQKGDRSKQQ